MLSQSNDLQCAPPYLHILLGVILKHHRMLEENAHGIDIQIASGLDKDFTDVAESLYSFGKNWQMAQEFKEKFESGQSCVLLSRG